MNTWVSRDQKQDQLDRLQQERDEAIAERDRLAEEVVRLRDQLEGTSSDRDDNDENDLYSKNRH